MRAAHLAVAAVVVAFAANSVVTRWLVVDQHMAPATTAWIRFLASGTAIAWWARGETAMTWRRAPLPALGLGIYAFALAIGLEHMGAGPGTFVLFAAITTGIIIGTWLQGSRPGGYGLAGVGLALVGIGVLAWSIGGDVGLIGVVAMAVSGLAWAGYTVDLRPRSGPVAGVARVHVVLAVALLPLGWWMEGPWPPLGIAGAVLMGAVATGLAYIAWQRVFPQLSGTAASVAQLSVPVVAAAGGALVLDEQITVWLVVAGLFVLAGAWLSKR